MKPLEFIFLLVPGVLFAESVCYADTNSTKFFPLSTGNAWTYEYYSPTPPPGGTRYRYRSTVSKDTLISGHKYYYITNTIHIAYTSTVHWFRVDSSSGNLLGFNPGVVCRPGDLFLVDSLASGLNDLAPVCTIPPIVRRRCYESDIITLFNQQVPRKIFNYEIIAASDYKTYAKNFGISYCYMAETGAYTITLLGCVLNGVLYGDTNLIGIKPISSEVPGEFFLYQNYPNPFNPATNLRFEIAELRFVRLVVYDILGREAAVLVNEQLKPGTYEVEFDGTNYPSGVYFYRIAIHSDKLISADYTDASSPQANPLSITKRMVIVK